MCVGGGEFFNTHRLEYNKPATDAIGCNAKAKKAVSQSVSRANGQTQVHTHTGTVKVQKKMHTVEVVGMV